MSKDQRSLKNLLINPRFQLRYIFWLTMTGLILIAVYTGIFYSYVQENYSILVDLSPMTDESKAQLYSELNTIVIRLFLFSIGFLILVSILGLKISHRVAGPLYHFKRVFQDISQGKKSARIHFRPEDDFQDVAAAFNEMMDKN